MPFSNAAIRPSPGCKAAVKGSRLQERMRRRHRTARMLRVF
jgi:hypothetical protein